MSWSVSFKRPVIKTEADSELNNLTLSVGEWPAYDQLRIAKTAAKVLIANIPGPYLMISLSGHANGVGWQKKSGMANDCININISQLCEEDMKAYWPLPPANPPTPPSE